MFIFTKQVLSILLLWQTSLEWIAQISSREEVQRGWNLHIKNSIEK